jgi:hypothetical protein
MKPAKDIIAEQLLTFAHLYHPTSFKIPPVWEIEAAAERILKALDDAGYYVVPKDEI